MGHNVNCSNKIIGLDWLHNKFCKIYSLKYLHWFNKQCSANWQRKKVTDTEKLIFALEFLTLLRCLAYQRILIKSWFCSSWRSFWYETTHNSSKIWPNWWRVWVVALNPKLRAVLYHPGPVHSKYIIIISLEPWICTSPDNALLVILTPRFACNESHPSLSPGSARALHNPLNSCECFPTSLISECY